MKRKENTDEEEPQPVKIKRILTTETEELQPKLYREQLEWKKSTTSHSMEIKVTSLAEYFEAVESLDKESHYGKYGRSGYVFRGLPSTKFSLLSSLQRLSYHDPDHARKVEVPIIRNFNRYCPDIPPDCKNNIWSLMSFMQHHGAPTRLVDWSSSVLVALNFATLEPTGLNPTDDAVVWCVEPHSVMKQAPSSLEHIKKRWMPTVNQLKSTFDELA